MFGAPEAGVPTFAEVSHICICRGSENEAGPGLAVSINRTSGPNFCFPGPFLNTKNCVRSIKNWVLNTKNCVRSILQTPFFLVFMGFSTGRLPVRTHGEKIFQKE
jgi:hypothetical protein